MLAELWQSKKEGEKAIGVKNVKFMELTRLGQWSWETERDKIKGRVKKEFLLSCLS